MFTWNDNATKENLNNPTLPSLISKNVLLDSVCVNFRYFSIPYRLVHHAAITLKSELFIFIFFLRNGVHPGWIQR